MEGEVAKYPFPINQKPISLHVRFKLTDNDNKPLPGVDVRLVFGCDPSWQKGNAGLRFVTNEIGEHHLTADVMLDKRRRKMPTNFLDSLFSWPQKTDHLKVGAELEYLGMRWLYIVDICRFPDKYTVMLDGFSIYRPDINGDFTKEQRRVDGIWQIEVGNGQRLTRPGFEPDGFMLQPNDDDPGAWTLRLGFKMAAAMRL